MASGYGSTPVISICEEDIRRLNLPSFELFKMVEENLNIEQEYDIFEILEFGQTDHMVYPEEKLVQFMNIYKDFQKEFKEETGVGIHLHYHDSENNGSDYDEVDGLFFTLDFSDVYQYTPEARELSAEAHFETKYYVYYG